MQKDHLSAKDVGEMGFHREFHDLDIPVCSAGDCTGPPRRKAMLNRNPMRNYIPICQKQ